MKQYCVTWLWEDEKEHYHEVLPTIEMAHVLINDLEEAADFDERGFTIPPTISSCGI